MFNVIWQFSLLLVGSCVSDCLVVVLVFLVILEFELRTSQLLGRQVLYHLCVLFFCLNVRERGKEKEGRERRE
jgi:hypothetical protein